MTSTENTLIWILVLSQVIGGIGGLIFVIRNQAMAKAAIVIAKQFGGIKFKIGAVLAYLADFVFAGAFIWFSLTAANDWRWAILGITPLTFRVIGFILRHTLLKSKPKESTHRTL